MLLPYESPELKGIPEEYIDKDHMYTGTKVITTGIAYNTDLVKDAPKGFADLTGEAFKDAVIMPSPLYSGAAAYNLGVLSRNETLGWDFFQGLKDNGITVDKGNGAIQKAVVAGEKSCGILVDYMANRSKMMVPGRVCLSGRRFTSHYRTNWCVKRLQEPGSSRSICRFRSF